MQQELEPSSLSNSEPLSITDDDDNGKSAVIIIIRVHS